MHTICQRTLILALLALFCASPAPASTWDAPSSLVAERANHSGSGGTPGGAWYIGDSLIYLFETQLLPELMQYLEDQSLSVRDYRLLSSSELEQKFPNLSSELREAIFGEESSIEERIDGMRRAFGLTAASTLFGFEIQFDSFSRAVDSAIPLITPSFQSEYLEGRTPEALVLYKIRYDNSRIPFHGYAREGSSGVDGWWVLTDAENQLVAPDQELRGDADYSITYWVRNNGPYDLSSSELLVDDPVALGFPNLEGESSGGGGGCVLAPDAGLSLEWLAVAGLAFALARCRRKWRS